MMFAFRSVQTAAALAAVLAAVPASAQRVDPLRVFDVTLQLPNQVMEASIREGQPLKLTLDGTDEFEFVPVMADAGQGVAVAVYRGRSNEPATRRLVERLALTVGTPAGLRSHTGIRVVLDRIRQASAPAPARQVAFVPARGLARTEASYERYLGVGRACETQFIGTPRPAAALRTASR